MGPDAVIVGGGPAGTSAAIRLRQIGLSVRLYEKAHYPRAKLCGGFLSPESLIDLEGLGVLEAVRDAGALTINRLKVVSSHGAHSEIHLPMPGLSLSRDLLDDILLRQAMAAGVDVHQGADGTQHFHEAPWSLMATGRNATRQPRSYYGVQAFFDEAEGISDQVELDLVPGGYVGLVRQGNHVNVCALTSQSRLQIAGPSLDAVLSMWAGQNATLRHHIQQARRVSPWQAVGPVSMGFRRLVDDHRIYIGDAACVVDPFAGEGIAMGLKSSALLQSAFSQSIMSIGEAYARSWHQTFDRALRVDSYLRSFLGYPVLQEACVLATRAFPPLLGWLTTITRPKEIYGNLQPYPAQRAV